MESGPLSVEHRFRGGESPVGIGAKDMEGFIREVFVGDAVFDLEPLKASLGAGENPGRTQSSVQGFTGSSNRM